MSNAYRAVCIIAALLLLVPGAYAVPSGVTYDSLVDALFAGGSATTTVGNNLWVPWFGRSDTCGLADLKSGSSCNSGGQIDFSHNCMVTDEFSQVGILVAMGQDQARMDRFYNTVRAIGTSFGNLPGWRVYRNGDVLEQCRSGINGNCDTASDADARIIIALFTASDNPLFTDQAQKAKYDTLARQLSAAFLQYEVEQTCRQSSLGYGDICYWLAAGSQAKKGGLGSTDFGYTGYYADAIIAMLQACTQTGNATYCAAAGNFTLNYLQAAKFNGRDFTVPPGRSFKWVNTNGVPAAQCTSNCLPDAWDGADAPRALGMCQANYYSRLINYPLPGLQQYCTVWGNRYMNDTKSAPLQYYQNGLKSAPSQSGYFAQGLEALFQAGGHNTALFQPTLDNALSHYSPSTRTWDYQACFGVYMQAFAIRALGVGSGRDMTGFPVVGALQGQSGQLPPPATPQPTPSQNSSQPPSQNSSPNIVPDSSSNTSPAAQLPPDQLATQMELLAPSCTAAGLPCVKTSDVHDGSCRSVAFSTQLGPIVILACRKPAGIEVYRKSWPASLLSFKVCLGSACVDQFAGFALLSSQQAPPSLAAASPPTPAIIASLPITCKAEGKPCGLISDVTSGVCRTLLFSTTADNLKILACEKSDGWVELYRQGAPRGIPFTACVEKGCITNGRGFVRFKPVTSSLPTAASSPQTTPSSQPSSPQPSSSPSQQSTPSSTPSSSSTPASSHPDVDLLAFTVKPSGTLVADYKDGSTCRRVQYTTPAGWIEVKACEKQTGYELYLLSSPTGASVCVGASCVGPANGFSRFS